MTDLLDPTLPLTHGREKYMSGVWKFTYDKYHEFQNCAHDLYCESEQNYHSHYNWAQRDGSGPKYGWGNTFGADKDWFYVEEYRNVHNMKPKTLVFWHESYTADTREPNGEIIPRLPN